MNRFQIIKGYEDDFEQLWKNRESYLDEVEGFLGFNLIKSKTYKDLSLIHI